VPDRPFELAAHPILSASWFSERELDFEPALDRAELEDASHPQWLSQLADADEDFGVSGPSLRRRRSRTPPFDRGWR
jgi:hypothetical protein